MIKNDLWCGYCGSQDFTELKDSEHPDDPEYSMWECTACKAIYQNNPGYGYFTVHWGKDSNMKMLGDKYSLNTGELMDESKLPRTPEGIVRHSGSKKELEAYLEKTQIK